MKEVFICMKAEKHRADSLSFAERLEAAGIRCLLCERCTDSGIGSLVITDDPRMAEICETAGTACIGYRPAGEGNGFFPHVSLVWESFDEIDLTEMEQFCRRFYGEPVVIARTKRLRIRESVPDDFEALARLGPCGSPWQEKESYERFCAYIKQAYPFYGYGYWTVELAEHTEDGGIARETVIGRCGLTDPDLSGGDGFVIMEKRAEMESSDPLFRLELGYAVAKEYQGRGCAFEMCRAVMTYGFETLGAGVILVRIRPENTASLRLARRLGFAVG